jgi:pimeloyl-ACP methyl ester carboxylesterase
MRKWLYFVIGFLLMSLIALTFFGHARQLNPNEIEAMKEGKSFWTWPSPDGSYSMHYVERGQGKKHIILVHGFAAHSYTWRHFISPLTNAGYHVWSLDLIGFGLSDKPKQAPYGLEFFLSQMEDFMKAHGIEEAHFVGNSMGGGLSLGMAIFHPRRVKSLTLIDALGYPLDLPFALSAGKNMGSILKPFIDRNTVRFMLKQIVYDRQTITEEQVDAYTIPFQMPGGTEAALAILSGFDNRILENLRTHFPTIKIPMLIIWGDQDRWIPLSHFERLKKDFPNAQTLLIPNCGHIPQEECPQPVIQALLHFFQSIKD